MGKGRNPKWDKVPSLHDESPEHQATCWNPWCKERLRLRLKREAVQVRPVCQPVAVVVAEPEPVAPPAPPSRYPWKHLHCWYCGLPMAPSGLRRKSRDHLTPLSRGGSQDDTNIVVCCQVCNGDKGSLTLAEYRCVVAFRNGVSPQEFKFWREEK